MQVKGKMTKDALDPSWDFLKEFGLHLIISHSQSKIVEYSKHYC